MDGTLARPKGGNLPTCGIEKGLIIFNLKIHHENFIITAFLSWNIFFGVENYQAFFYSASGQWQ
jgi:hypothetical protein